MIGHGGIKEYMSVLATCFNVIWFITKLLEAEVLTLVPGLLSSASSSRSK